MINPIEAIEQMVEAWAYESRCGYCWQFSAPLRFDDLNEYQVRDEDSKCCILVAVTDYSFECIQNFNRQTGFKGLGAITHDFQLHFITHDRLDRNVYDEIKGHPDIESKWHSILQPLQECIGCDPFDWCLQIGKNIEVSRWRASTRIDWLDSNYTGWSISVQLRENNIG